MTSPPSNPSLFEHVKVFVRSRPLLPHEFSQNPSLSVTIPSPTEIILVSPDPHKPGQKVFSFDGVFSSSSEQQEVYESCAFSLVEAVFEGYNATIFAYGQTGSGKTYSMMGSSESDISKGDISDISKGDTLLGIMPRSFEHVMRLINTCAADKSFFITASFLEIYNEEIHDLLVKSSPGKPCKCELRESSEKGFFVKDLSQKVVHSVSELLVLLAQGNKQRVIGETLMNDKSSRSHTLFGLRIESSQFLGANVKPKISAGKLNLVDLAGSERQNKTQATDERFKEGVKINLSLSALGNVISALADGNNAKKHIPYRDSKLTKLLQDSLGGNSKTIMLANINPSSIHYEETLGTLRYASRTKLITNKPKMNEDPKDMLIKNYMEEIQKLKELLAKKGDFQEAPSSLMNFNEENDKIMKDLRENHEKAIEDLKEKEKTIDQMKEKEDMFEKIRRDKEKLEMILLEKEQALIQGHQGKEENSQLEAMRKRIK